MISSRLLIHDVNQRSVGHEIIIESSYLENTNTSRISLEESSLRAYDSEILTGWGIRIPLGILHLERCTIIGSVDSWQTTYIDCEFNPQLDANIRVKFSGNNGRMENCTVNGDLYVEFGENMSISNSTINGNLRTERAQGTIILTDFNGERNDVNYGQFLFRRCIFQNGCTFDCFQELLIDSCIFYDAIRVGLGEETNFTFQKNLVFGILGRIYCYSGVNISNNTIFVNHHRRPNGRNYLMRISVQSDNESNCIYNNIFYTTMDSCDLFDFTNRCDDLLDVRYNCIWGFIDITWNNFRPDYELDETNLITHPSFLSLEPFDPRLKYCSPCIDAGDPESPPDPDSTRADMGAYYFHQPTFMPESKYQQPREMQFMSPYPNPFNSMTRITYNLSESGRVYLSIHDIQGREVAVLIDGAQSSGLHNAVWSPIDVSSGIYFCRMESAGGVKTMKLTLIR